MAESRTWKVRDRSLDLGGKTVIAGILNVTPDSFSDGGEHTDVSVAVGRAERMLDEGAALVDVGGESTRPGFAAVSIEEESDRVEPVIERIVERYPNCILSIDTSKSKVAHVALEAGARVINAVCGFRTDPEIAEVAAAFSAGAILMWNGRIELSEGSILDRIRRGWECSLGIALDAGVAESAIVLDPGIGFGTTRQEDLEVLRGLSELRGFGFPLMLGTSRKRITAEPLDLPLEQRLEPTLATAVAGIAAGVEIFRVHDVAEHARMAGLADLIYKGGDLDD